MGGLEIPRDFNLFGELPEDMKFLLLSTGQRQNSKENAKRLNYSPST